MQLLEFIGNHLFLSALLLSLVLLLVWDVAYSAARGASLLSPAELTILLNRQQATLLDVRSSRDYDSGHILNARNMPAETLAERGSTLDDCKTNPLILYCNNGGLSGRQGRILKGQGFQQVYVLKGGMQEWRHANLPLARGAQGKKAPPGGPPDP